MSDTSLKSLNTKYFNRAGLCSEQFVYVTLQGLQKVGINAIFNCKFRLLVAGKGEV